jgi:hypothetical protein
LYKRKRRKQNDEKGYFFCLEVLQIFIGALIVAATGELQLDSGHL